MLVLCFTASEALAVRAQDAQRHHADVLTARGLHHEGGATWVLETETPTLKEFKDVRAHATRLRSGEMQLRNFEANQDPRILANAYRAQAAMYDWQLALLNQQLQQYGYSYGSSRATSMYRNFLNQQRNMVVQEQQRLNGMANNANSQAPQFEQQKKQYSDEIEKTRQSYQEAVDKLRASVASVMSTYTGLMKDEPVVIALADRSAAARIKQKLGPSKEFLTLLNWLGIPPVQSETFDLRRVGGVDHIDAQLSGGSPISMVLDPTVVQIVLPAGIAAGLALKPTNRVAEWKASDGQAFLVPEMTIPSVHVGRMTAHNVACAIVPAQHENIAPVLGRSFLEKFDYKYLPKAVKLVLIKNESDHPSENAKPDAAKSRATGR
jgi:hypothetical protein